MHTSQPWQSTEFILYIKHCTLLYTSKNQREYIYIYGRFDGVNSIKKEEVKRGIKKCMFWNLDYVWAHDLKNIYVT
jgi:hypothetical protein